MKNKSVMFWYKWGELKGFVTTNMLTSERDKKAEKLFDELEKDLRKLKVLPF